MKDWKYPIAKMILGGVCLVLSAEYTYAYAVYYKASFGISYIGDAVTWALAGAILFVEGIHAYQDYIKEAYP